MNKLPERPVILCALIMIMCGFVILSFGEIVAITAFLIFVALSIIFLALVVLTKSINKKVFALICISFLLGAVVPFINFALCERGADRVINMLQGDVACFEGVVASTDVDNNYTNLVLKITKVNDKKLLVPLKATAHFYEVLNVKDNFAFSFNAKAEHISNYSDFDNITYRKSDRIFIDLIPESKITLSYDKPTFTGVLKNIISTALNINVINKDYETGAVANAIITGNKQGVPKSVLRLFSKCGISHILSVSGLHISIVISFIYEIFVLFRLNAKIGYPILCFCGVIYMFVASFTPSVCRAVIVIVILYFGLYFKARSDALNSLCIAAIILFLVNPYNIYDIGVQLSFMASLGLLFSGKVTSAIERAFYNKPALSMVLCNTVTCLFATVFTLPICAVNFGELSVVSVFANVFIVPIISVILPLLVFTVVFFYVPYMMGVSAFMGKTAGLLIGFVCDCAQYFADMKLSVIPAVCNTFVITLFCVSIALIFVVHAFSKNKIVFVSVLLPFAVFISIIAMSVIKYKDFCNDSVVYYFRSYYNEAITLKASKNRFLYISLSDDTVPYDLKCSMIDNADGQNWYFPVAIDKYKIEDIISNIDLFCDEYKIKYLCLSQYNEIHMKLYDYYKDKNKFSIIFLKDSFKFGEFIISFKCSDKYEYFEIYEKSKLYGLLKAKDVDSFALPVKRYDSFVFSPVNNSKSPKDVRLINSGVIYSAWYSDTQYSGAVNLRKTKFAIIDN